MSDRLLVSGDLFHDMDDDDYYILMNMEIVTFANSYGPVTFWKVLSLGEDMIYYYNSTRIMDKINHYQWSWVG